MSDRALLTADVKATIRDVPDFPKPGILFKDITTVLGDGPLFARVCEHFADLARECGADEVILYSQHDFEAELKRLTGGLGVDVVYDSVGKDTFEKSLNCLKSRGLMVLYGQSSGKVEPQDPQILNRKGSLYLTRPTLGHYLQTRQEFLGRANDLFRWVAGGTLQVRLDQTFPLEQAVAAQTYMEERRTLGKVLIIPQ